VGNSTVAEPEEIDGEKEFDPWLGMVVADSWWKLGKKFARILTTEGDARTKNLDEWVAEVCQALTKDSMEEAVPAVTRETLMDFVNTTMTLLERKYEGGAIAKDVLRLTKNGNRIHVYDVGQYVDIQEEPDTFWAIEYKFLFQDLDKFHAPGWINAVGRCADPECNTFFIKARSDQRHHTNACRTRSANRLAYVEKAGVPAHGKRGRPRVRKS
jgi:hypothetical protein